MTNKHKRTLDAAAALTAAVVLIAAAYLGYRAFDYWSADRAYEDMSGGVVSHVSFGESEEDLLRNGRNAPADDGRKTDGKGRGSGTGTTESDGQNAGSQSQNGESYDREGEATSQKNAALKNGEAAPPDWNSTYPERPVIDWKKLSKSGDDIVAWLEIPALEIAYPVVQGGDNEYYLHHLPNGEYKRAGSLFMETSNHPDLTDANTIIYGHNMNNGSMFGKFRTMTQDDYEACPYLWICTPKMTCLYRMYSIHISRVDDASYTLFGRRTETDGNVLAWIAAEHARSYLDMPIPESNRGCVVTLSTCASLSDSRRVVQGVLVWEYIRPP